MLRLFGIPVAIDDARSLVATLVADRSTRAIGAAARIAAVIERPNGPVELASAHRNAILSVLEEPPDGLAELRGVLADDLARRRGIP